MDETHARARIEALKQASKHEGTITYPAGKKVTCTYSVPMKFGRPDLDAAALL